MQPDDVEQADNALRIFGAARVAHSDAADRLTIRQRQRAQQKTAALVRLCATTHPVTGKWYSVSQAEDVLQLDLEYANYKAAVTEAETEVRDAYDDKVAAYLNALAKASACGGRVPLLPMQGVA